MYDAFKKLARSLMIFYFPQSSEMCFADAALFQSNTATRHRLSWPHQPRRAGGLRRVYSCLSSHLAIHGADHNSRLRLLRTPISCSLDTRDRLIVGVYSLSEPDEKLRQMC